MFSFSSLLSDTRNFISNNLFSIIISLVVLAIVMQLIALFLIPDLSSLKDIQVFIQQTELKYGEISQNSITQMIQTLTPEEMQRIMASAISYLSKWLITQVILVILSTSVIISLIYNVAHNSLSISNLILHSTRVVRQIILLSLLGLLAGIIVFIFFALLPPLGLMLALVGMVLYQLIFMIFSAIIIEPNSNQRFMKKINISFQVLKREISNILPMLIIYFVLSFALNYLGGLFADDNFVLSVILNLVSLLINLFVICYFYRLYSLSNGQLSYDSRN